MRDNRHQTSKNTNDHKCAKKSESFGQLLCKLHSEPKRRNDEQPVPAPDTDYSGYKRGHGLFHLFSGAHLKTSGPEPSKMKNMHSSMRTSEPTKNNLRGAVEGGDGIAIVLGVLQKLEEVVSGDNSGGDVASSYHGCSWNEVNDMLEEHL